MQCNWQPFARLAFHGIARPWPIPQSRTIHTYVKSPPAPWAAGLNPLQSLKNSLQSTHRRQYATVLPSTPLPFTKNTSPPLKNHMGADLQASTPPISTLTPAQVGRTAASAVRISIQEGNLADAYLIVRSLYHAHRADKRRATPQPIQRFLGRIEGTPIPFNKAVSPRLPAHTLLHSLIRLGEHQQAADLAQQMMKSGTTVRCPSLEAVLRALHDESAASPPRLLAPMISLKTLDATCVRPHMRENANLTGAALLLVQTARGAGQRSTRRMFRYLMALCIINGEIILASLVFGVMLREWQARQQAMQAAIAGDAPPVVAGAPPPQPRLADLKPILAFVNWNLAAPQTDESSKVAFNASFQALANLAHAMDKGYMTINLEPIIAAIHKCPRSKEEVWIPGKKLGSPPRLLEGYKYCHFVLDRLVFSLPDKEYGGEPRKKKDPGKQDVQKKRYRREGKPGEYKIDPMNPWAYNTLLNYTLRHRHSIRRALIVLTRMLEHPEADLPENMALTNNILDRAQHDFPLNVVSKMMASVGLVPQDGDTLLKLVSVRDEELDQYALSTHIAGLVRTGHGWDVVNVLPTILPGLFPPPTPQGVPFQESVKMKARHREEGLPRAIALGPVVFCSLLNALRKVGKTGLAETVFLYGLEAEAKSFVCQVAVVRPWCLPVHAYTTMLQAYKNERRKTYATKRFAFGWGLTVDGERIQWTDDMEPISRTELAEKMIVLIYHSMMAAPSAIASRLADLEARLAVDTRRTLDIGPSQLVPPTPDQWFFEALLDIFIRTPRDPTFPSMLKAMAEHGYVVSEEAQDTLRDNWGEAMVQEVLAARDGVEKLPRHMRPLKMHGGSGQDSVVGRLGWKKWRETKVSLEVARRRPRISRRRTGQCASLAFETGRERQVAL